MPEPTTSKLDSKPAPISTTTQQPATAEQIMQYLQLVDDSHAVFQKIKYNFIPLTLINYALNLMVEFGGRYDERREELKERYPVFQYWNFLYIFFAFLVPTFLYLFHKVQESYKDDIKFLPYFSNDLTQAIDNLYGEIIESSKIKDKIKHEEKMGWYIKMVGHFIDWHRATSFFHQAIEMNHGLSLLAEPTTSLTFVELLKNIAPTNLFYELSFAFYKWKYSQHQHQYYLQQVKQWSHCDLWQKSKPLKTGRYFFDLAAKLQQDKVDILLDHQKITLPVKIFFRELTMAFLQIGLPVIYFDDRRVVLYDWHGQNIRNKEAHLASFNESLTCWQDIYLNKEKKLNQLNYISRQLKILTPDQEPLVWQMSKYRTTKNLPAVYFSTDVSELEANKAQIIFLEIQRIYGLEQVKMNNNYIVVDGVGICHQRINIDALKFLSRHQQTIPNLEVDSTSDLHSKTKHRQKKAERTDDTANEGTKENNNEQPSEQKIDEKVLKIQEEIKFKYPNHVVVHLNSPKKDPGRSFAIVEEQKLKKAMDTYGASYSDFMKSFQHISRVKSNNRENGSSSTGLVGAVEPFRQFDGRWETSCYKYKLSKNSRVFFTPVKKETTNNEQIEIIKASGFDPTYHRGRK